MVAERAVAVIQEMVNQAEPTHFVYISIDGVAPRAKMNQQRTRRYMAGTAWHKYLDLSRRRLQGGQTHRHTPDQPLYESNAITPGTEFMHAMQTRLAELFAARSEEHKYTAWGQVTLVLSTTASAGEGEHKIMNILRRLAPLSPAAAWAQLESTIRNEHVGEPAQFFPGAADTAVHLGSAEGGAGAAERGAEHSPVHMMVYGNDADWMPLLLGVTNTALLTASHVEGGALSSTEVTLPTPGVQCSILRPASKDAMFRSGVLKKGHGKNKFGKKRRRNKCADAGKVVGAHAEHAAKAAGGDATSDDAPTGELPQGVASGKYELIPLNELWLELGVWLINTALKCDKAQRQWHEQQGAAATDGPVPDMPAWVSATKMKAFRKELGGGSTLPGAVAGTVSSSILWLACRAVDDFVCLLTMVGNDFLPSIPGISMRHNVRSVLLRDRGLGLDAVVEGYLSRVLLPAARASVEAHGVGWVMDSRGLPVMLFDRELVARDIVRHGKDSTPAHLRLLGVQRSGLSLGAVVRLAASESVQHAEHGCLLTAVDGVVDSMQGGMRKPVQPSSAPPAAAAAGAAGAAEAPASHAESGTFDPNDLAAAIFDMDGSDSDDSEDQRAMAEAQLTVHELTRGTSDDLVHAADTLARMDKAAPTQDVRMHSSDLCPHTGTARVVFSQIKLDHYFNKMGFQFEAPHSDGASSSDTTKEVGVFAAASPALQAAVAPEALASYPAHSDELLKLVTDWLSGLVFVMRYYFLGVPSWHWFYPHHYSPFASDIAALGGVAGMSQPPTAGRMDEFDSKCDQPVSPLTQLLAVVPPSSWHLLPPWTQQALAGAAVPFPSPTSTLQGVELSLTQQWAVPDSPSAGALAAAEQQRADALRAVGVPRWTPPMEDVVVDEEDAHKDYEVIVKLPFIPVAALLGAESVIAGE